MLMGLAALLLAQVGGWLWFNRFRGSVAVESPTVVESRADSMVNTTDAKTIPPLLLGKVVVAQGGEAQMADGDSAQGWQPVVPGAVVRAGSRLRAGSATTVDFCYEDGSRLRLYAHSELMLTETNGAKRVGIESGALDATVVPQTAGCEMKLAADGLIMVVRGTEFRVVSDEEGAVWLGVRQGKVAVAHTEDESPLVVKRGFYVATAKGWPFAPLPTTCPYWQAQCISKTGTRYR
jgi:hypothetical protein